MAAGHTRIGGPVPVVTPYLNTAIVAAHYHPRGLLRDDFLGLVSELQRLSATVLLVSTNLTAEQRERLPAGIRVVVRENHGYDFYSYKVGLEALGDLQRLQRVVLMNSSFICVDRHKLLRGFFDAGLRSFDVFGLTESRQYAPHVQSFLFSFGTRCIQSAAFRRWWAEVAPIDERQRVIDTYELGLSRFLHEAGFTLGCAYRPSRLQKVIALWRSVRRGRLTLDPRRLNPTHFYWDFLLHDFGIVKVELVRTDPHALLDKRARNWISALTGAAGVA